MIGSATLGRILSTIVFWILDLNMVDKGLKLCCSCCGKSKEEVKNLFYGKGALIRDQCVEIAFDANTKKLIENHLLKKG
ncbi:MAG: hypothetical protein CML39_01480 [Rhodobacteraceae bacterium]|nr:MAG: hypothetical protein CML39_01480 [Paracoccaceae bacterium]